VTTTKDINEMFYKVYEEEFARIGKTGISAAEVQKLAVDRVKTTYSLDEIAEALLPVRADDALRAYGKRRSLSAVLAQSTSQASLFPVEILEAVIDIDGVIVKAKHANIQTLSIQKERYVQNNVKQQAAYVRNMQFIGAVERTRMKDDPSVTLGDVWEDLGR